MILGTTSFSGVSSSKGYQHTALLDLVRAINFSKGEVNMKNKQRKTKRKWPVIMVSIFALALIAGLVAALSDPEKRNGSDKFTREEYYENATYYIRDNHFADANIILTDSKMWDNEGFKEVQGVFKSMGVEHTFHIRYADKDIVLVEIDGVKEFSDVDKMIEFMDQQNNKE